MGPSLARLRRSIVDRTLFIAILSAVLYWAAFPPISWSWAAWLVAALWTALIKRHTIARPDSTASSRGQIPDAKTNVRNSRWSVVLFYAKIWIAGTLFWLLSFHWMSHLTPVWTKVVWVLFASGLAMTWVAFIGLSRTAIWFNVPVVVAAPLIWCGIEWLRKNIFFGGFSYASLEHTQYRSPLVIQTADIAGEYFVGMIIVFVGACIGHLMTWNASNEGPQTRRVAFHNLRGFAIAGAIGIPMLAIAYGYLRMSWLEKDGAQDTAGSAVKVALLQGSIDNSVDTPAVLSERRFAQYQRLADCAASGMDLVVWPENSCPLPLYQFESNFVPDGWEGQPRERVDDILASTLDENHRQLVALAKTSGANLLLGLDTTVFQRGLPIERRNSAIAIDRKGGVGPRYDKVMLVPFLEYMPFSRWNPLREADSSHYTNGQSCVAFPLVHVSSEAVESPTITTSDNPSMKGEVLWAAVNICFESSFPHFIRNRVVTLSSQGKKPDVLINISNDGSWRYPSMAEMHLATHVFRAVENRTQYLTATNAGYSAWIDRDGRIIRQGRRRSLLTYSPTFITERR